MVGLAKKGSMLSLYPPDILAWLQTLDAFAIDWFRLALGRKHKDFILIG